jgi:hypothetical protein
MIDVQMVLEFSEAILRIPIVGKGGAAPADGFARRKGSPIGRLAVKRQK